MRLIRPSLIFCFVVIGSLTLAQSKLVPVTQSALAGISLPAGTKQDSRLLVTATAQTLLDMEAETNGIVLAKNVEVLSLPPNPESEKMVFQQLAEKKWSISKLPTNSYYLLQRESLMLMAYVQALKKETSVYFCTIERLATSPESQESLPPSVPTVTPQAAPKKTDTPAPQATPKSAFSFTTTNFDDGWVATAHENWVNVAKGNIRVLIHFHTKETSSYISDYTVEDRLAWNTFIVPRYGNINYIEGPSTIGYERPHFLYNQVNDTETGRPVFLVLFSMGKSNWMEFIAPDQNAFAQVFGIDITRVDYYSSEIWNPLRKMNGYNKFAVAATDLPGKWSSSFGGFTNYVNVYTGATTANTHSSAEEFVFRADGTYNWQLSTASGFVGSIKFDGAKSTGKFTMPNPWQIDFSEIEKKQRLYNAYFSCERNGARILWLQDTGYGDYRGFGRE